MKLRAKIAPIASLAILCGVVAIFQLSSQPPSQKESPDRPNPTGHLVQPHTPQEEQTRTALPVDVDTPTSAPTQKTAKSIAPTTAVTPKASKISPHSQIAINGTTYPLRLYRPASLPNDPLADQWGIQTVNLPAAWDTPPGSKQTTLAIIDTGFALQHEEFTNRWYTNTNEVGATSSEGASLLNCTDRSLPLDMSCNLVDDDSDGTVDNETGATPYENPSLLNCTDQGSTLDKQCNRIDDDHNGLIDDTHGWDFASGDPTPQAGQLNPIGTGTTHGTKVAGVAAATGNNGVGVAGVDWQTHILPIQALDDDGYGDTLSVGKAIHYAISQGANVISLSVGSALPDPYVEQAVRDATAAGIVVVAAAGNDGCNCMLYPANYPEVVGVGALDQSNEPASFSSYGQNLDIMAPGVNLTSSTWSNTNTTSAYATSLSGTSFATPMVSGMLSRLLSQQPSATPLQLIASITETTNRSGISAATPHSTTLGYGTLDASASTLRMGSAYNPQWLYALANISLGNYLTPSTPTEHIAASYKAYQCPSPRAGGTPIYTLTKGNERFFTLSAAEMSTAKANGYTSTLFAYGCVTQPQDMPQSVRDINTKREF